ncbi:MAG: T9SS type A sorting domain-containing protein [Bacteroidota bacterium]|nr:T9SS type A sorting domain-containing protein [Bacteroidota bacterium]
MKRILVFFILYSITLHPQLSVSEKLIVLQNDAIVNGNFKIAVQVEAGNLPGSKTLASATIDVQIDTAKLSYINAANWGLSASDGYSRTANLVNSKIRIGILGTLVNGNGDGTPGGIDIVSPFATWVELNFKIKDISGTTALSIDPFTNAVAIFNNAHNNPSTGGISNILNLSIKNIGDQPLPVELSSFSGKIKNSNVILSWITQTEVDNYGFDIERKNNTKDGSWEKIGFVRGNGNSNSVKNYSFIDKYPMGGSKFEYRLAQIDNDKTTKISNTLEITIAPAEYELFQNYPNPFNPSTTIRYSVPVESKIQIKIYNTLGQEIKTLVDNISNPGNYEYILNGSTLASGVYLYTFSGQSINNPSTFKFVKKMILLK